MNTQEDRLVDAVSGKSPAQQVIIVQCRYHY
jgi:hypothetical protein